MKKAITKSESDATVLQSRILTIRGQKVILDADLAGLYGVSTKVLNQAVKRNRVKFPADFMYQLSLQDVENLRSQIVTSSSRHGGRRYAPFVFTEHGAIMAATVLNSPRAVHMSVFVVRAFVQMRAALTGSQALEKKLAALEREVRARLDNHDAAIVDVLRRFMAITDPPPLPEPPPKPPIGFREQCSATGYGRVRKRRGKS